MSLQARLETIRSSPIPRNEESAKVQILVPLLQSLGWDFSELLPEHHVGEMSRRGRVDIALKAQGHILGLIEAKAPGTVLDNHVDQVLGYAFYESVEICALTTGLEWWFYLPGARVPVPQRRFAVLRIMDDPIRRLSEDFTSFLGKKSVVSGRAGKLANSRLEEVRLNSEVPRIWQQMTEEPDNALVELVRRRVYEDTHLQLTNKQVMAVLQGSPIPSAATVTTPAAAPLAAPPSEQDQPVQSWKSWGKPTAIVLWDKRYPVSSHIGAMRKFVDLLYERHHDDFDRVLEVRGGTYPHAARDPKTLAPSYPRHEPMSSGYSVALSNDPEDIKRRGLHRMVPIS